MNWKNIYEIIKEAKETKETSISYLYHNDLLDLQKLYTTCAEWLYLAEMYNYPKQELSVEEQDIYKHSPYFYESIQTGGYQGKVVYSATYKGKRLV